MRASLITDLFLGFALQFFGERKNTKAVAYIKKVQALKQSGERVDEHMQTIADFLTGDEKPDFADLTKRINAEVDELQARDAGEAPPPSAPGSGGSSTPAGSQEK